MRKKQQKDFTIKKERKVKKKSDIYEQKLNEVYKLAQELKAIVDKSEEKINEAFKLAQELKAIVDKVNEREEYSIKEDLKIDKELKEKIQSFFSKETSFKKEIAKELLEYLKNTPLYDKKEKQWNLWFDKKRQLQDSNRSSRDQLLGVIAEAVAGNIFEAKQLLESLKKTPLYDQERKQWNLYMDEKQQLQDSNRFSRDQLLGVIAEAVAGNIFEAKQLLESLKKTPLYYKETKQWNWYMDEKQQLQNVARYSYDQLLGVIAEAVAGNIFEAKQLLESLKKTPLYDQERKQWNNFISIEQQFRDSSRNSYDQLLGVIAEAVAGNIFEAKQLLESLKKTPLYDQERKQWNSYMNKEQQLQSSECYSFDQLLGVIVEAFAEKPEEFVKWFTKS
jgi:membrane protein required for beta-lactamase induction